MTLINPDSPLQVGDMITLCSAVGGEVGEVEIVGVFAGNVYKTSATVAGNKSIFIRRATHKAGKETGIFVFVTKNETTGRWSREETGQAMRWGCRPRRPVDQSATY